VIDRTIIGQLHTALKLFISVWVLTIVICLVAELKARK